MKIKMFFKKLARMLKRKPVKRRKIQHEKMDWRDNCDVLYHRKHF